jgi:hypothetical protein
MPENYSRKYNEEVERFKEKQRVINWLLTAYIKLMD